MAQNSPAISSRIAVAAVTLIIPFTTVGGTGMFMLWSVLYGGYASRVLVLILVLWTAIDYRTPSSGGRPWPRLWAALASPFWTAFRTYFPATTLPAPALSPGPCLVCVHPHGIWGSAVWSNLMLGTGGMSPTLEARQPRTVTLGANFFVPVWRDYLLSLGFISACVPQQIPPHKL